MSIFHDNAIVGASGQAGYNLTRSLRFRSSASAYLSRTPSSAGNRQTWTHSCWVKRGKISSETDIFSGYASGSDRVFWGFESGDTLQLYASAGAINVQTSAVFRDPSAWYHVFIAFDTTQATSTNRIKIYVNGVQQTTSGTFPNQNTTWAVNNTNAHYHATGTTSTFSDFYLAETNFIDGQALTPSSFGQTSSTTGVWQPKRYTGTYGTNGFYLPFTDNSALTSGSNAGLGKDFSGNGNYWNTNNISITSGSTYDSMTDVPTLTSATAANFAVLSPIQKNSSVTVSQANLYGVSSAANQTLPATIYANSGKWYAEFTCVTAGLEDMLGIITDTFNFGASFYQSNQLLVARSSGDIFYSSAATFGGPTWTAGDTIQIKLDLDNQTVGWAKNGGSYTTATITSYDGHTAGKNWTFAIKNGASGGNGNFYYNANFGQRPFAYTPPTGYVALNTYNLPTPTIGATASSQANKYFDATLYTGTGSALTVTNSGSMQPDLVWIKSRSTVENNLLFDSVRGSSPNYNYLISNLTNAEATPGVSMLTAINSNGFTLGTNGGVNTNAATFVGWQWKANGSGSSNTAGSITSTVSANTTSGFSVVTYTGTGSAATVGHGLGVAPKMIIVKNRNGVESWRVGHAYLNGGSSPWNYYVNLNTNAAPSASSSVFNNTAPTSSVFSIANDSAINGSGQSHVAYCFAEVAGFSKFGSYTVNGSTDGPFIYTGFRPRWILLRNLGASGWNWTIIDTARNTYNLANAALYPDLSNAEGTANNIADILSNGFKIRTTWGNINAEGPVIYAAFAENPFKYSLAR